MPFFQAVRAGHETTDEQGHAAPTRHGSGGGAEPLQPLRRCVVNLSRRGFLTTAASGIAVAAVRDQNSSAASEGLQSPLEIRALRLQEIVETRTVQSEGMLPMLVRAHDYQLPSAEDYRGAYRHRHLLGKTEAEIGIAPMHVWRAWENTAADTAFYLGACAYQYRCTSDPSVRAICSRTLRALYYIFQLAVAKGERGFLCKPYGGQYSNQTSGDQVQCVVTGLAAWRPLASPDERALIDEMTVAFADHQIEVDFDALHGYFAHPRGKWGWEYKDWTDAMIYVPLLHLAWNTTGDEKYLAAIRRWYDHCGLEKRAAVTAETFRGSPACRMLYLPSLMMEFDPQNHELWRSHMRAVFTTCRTGILPDGTSWYSWEYDQRSGRLTPRDAGWGGGPTRTGRSAIFAMACVTAQRWLPEADMQGVARGILENLDEPRLRFVLPASDDTQLSPEWQVEGRLLDHDSLTGWLWAYWDGRWRGYW